MVALRVRVMMTDGEGSGATRRPAVSVVVPFAGDREAAGELLAALEALELRPGDELIVADNNQAATVAALAPPPAVRVVHAPAERSSYHARNRGAEAAANEWLLFTDADCLPGATLIDDYFEPAPGPAVGALAGAVSASGGATLVERWGASREPLGRPVAAGPAARPAAVTANLLVRREAWRSVGGFCEGVRSGGDLELCWRLADAGWALDWRPRAGVRHRHRRSLPALVRQMRRYGAGNAWQERRRPGASPPPRALAHVPRMLAAALRRAARGRFEGASMAALDGLALTANALGRLEDNSAPRPAPAAAGPRSLAVFVDSFPVISQTFVASEARALREQGWRVRVEAGARPQRQLLGGARGWRVDYLEDEGPATRAAALAWLAARHPWRCFADLARRGRWPAAERLPLRGLAPSVRRLCLAGDVHVHAHFAGPAATHALRAGQLAGLPVSIAAHGYDIYAAPSGLREKLERASFVAATCEYTRRDLRALLGPAEADKVQRVVMGVDGERFRRRSPPPPEGGTVVAIGRYVEKKGFAHLLEAAAILRRNGLGPPPRIVIAGDGPLRGELEHQVARLGLEGAVELPRADGFEAVRELLEAADLMAMPCVIAADGDRDSMPVVVKEALAMEVPVVASDEVGLPELVRPEWGRLVPPGDAGALAAAIAELLELPAGERAAMGRAGRAFVLEHCDVGREAERLAGLIERARAGYNIGVR
jgi:colanic acid/amylovoran biosynthesis glycosyltransferase